MTKFKELLSQERFLKRMDSPSVAVTHHQHTLFLRFDSKDIVQDAAYEGPLNPWLSSLCFLTLNKHLSELLNFSWKNWENSFQEDQLFWELRQEEGEKFFHEHFELLKASVEVYRGRDYLYLEQSPLICRCFGVRESDVVDHLKTEANPTLETLGGSTKASMGCRSCVPQLKRWLLLHETKKESHHYKNRPIADWLIDIDYMLSCFPKALEWKMEVIGFKGNQVSITFDKKVSQREEEGTAKELQDFLSASVDLDLAFFLLSSARHLSNAKG